MTTEVQQLPPYSEVEKSIVFAIILSIVTFGIYYFFWQAHQMKVMNRLLGTDKYNFWKWAILSFFTFGLYHIYYEYVMGTDLVAIQKKYGRPVSEYLPLVCVLLAVCAFSLVADAVQQYEMHQLYDHPKAGLPL